MTARTPIVRHDNWPRHFYDFLAERNAMPFAWGSNDCALFAAACVQAISGHDIASAYVGLYDNAAGTLSVISQAGGLQAICQQHLGDPIPVAMAQRGDVVYIQHPQTGRDCLAICCGNELASPGPDGLLYVPVSNGIMAWRV